MEELGAANPLPPVSTKVQPTSGTGELSAGGRPAHSPNISTNLTFNAQAKTSMLSIEIFCSPRESNKTGVVGEIQGRRLIEVAIERKPFVPDAHEPIRIAEGEWIQEHAVHDAEDRSVGSDTERERQNRDGVNPELLRNWRTIGAEPATISLETIGRAKWFTYVRCHLGVQLESDARRLLVSSLNRTTCAIERRGAAPAQGASCVLFATELHPRRHQSVGNQDGDLLRLVARHDRLPLLFELDICALQVLAALLGITVVAAGHRFVVARREVENVDELAMRGLELGHRCTPSAEPLGVEARQLQSVGH